MVDANPSTDLQDKPGISWVDDAAMFEGIGSTGPPSVARNAAKLPAARQGYYPCYRGAHRNWGVRYGFRRGSVALKRGERARPCKRGAVKSGAQVRKLRGIYKGRCPPSPVFTMRAMRAKVW